MSTSEAKSHHFKLGFLIVFVIALGLRFSQLNALPLDDIEAVDSLSALALAENKSPIDAINASYSYLTSTLFRMLGSNEWIARFWPALAGSLLAFLPYMFRNKWGQSKSLILASGIAILGPFVALSRFAGGESLGLLALGLALISFSKSNWTWSGALLAIGLLSGPTIYLGLISVMLSLIIGMTLFRKTTMGKWLAEGKSEWQKSFDSSKLAIGFFAGLLVASTVFLTRLQGLSLIGNGLATFIEGWRTQSGLPLNQMLLAGFSYALPVFIFAAFSISAAIKNKDPKNQLLLTLFVTSLALVLVYPGRRAEDLVWPLIPALILAADLLSRWLSVPAARQPQVVATLFLLLVLAIFQWLNFAALSNFEIGTEAFQSRVIVTWGVPVVAVIALALIAGGWSRDVPVYALAIAGSSILIAIAISQSARIGKADILSPNSLWRNAQAPGQAYLMAESLHLLSDLNYGRSGELYADLRFESPGMEWLLREWPIFERGEGQLTPDVIIDTDSADLPAESASYRGQDFVWTRSTSWPEKWPPNFFAWWLFQEAPTQNQNIALWAREDLFPQNFEEVESSEAVIIE
jgi:hypothetical protein